MTAWNEGGSRLDFVAQVAGEIMAEDEQADNPIGLPAGLMSLCGILLTQLEKETGRKPALTLQDIATRYRLKE